MKSVPCNVPSYAPKYNPKRDVKRVAPDGSLDLKAAMANNTIPSDLVGDEGKFNKIEDPSSISTRVRDRIDSSVLHAGVRSAAAEIEAAAANPPANE